MRLAAALKDLEKEVMVVNLLKDLPRGVRSQKEETSFSWQHCSFSKASGQGYISIDIVAVTD